MTQSEPKKWYQDNGGNSSAMRWMAMYALGMAVLLSLVQAYAALKCETEVDLYGLIATFMGAAFGGKVLQKGFKPGGGITS